MSKLATEARPFRLLTRLEFELAAKKLELKFVRSTAETELQAKLEAIDGEGRIDYEATNFASATSTETRQPILLAKAVARQLCHPH